jgi:hypothetical protein
MDRVLPSPFLFRWSFTARFVADLPKPLGGFDDWAESCRLPDASRLDSAGESWAKLSAAWNDGGVAVAVRVRGKRKPLHTDSQTPIRSDGLELWLDTRGTQNVHRATRFCHRFCVLPRGIGRKDSKPVVYPIPFANTREGTPAKAPPSCPAEADILEDGYDLSVWLPAGALSGFDPEANPRLGFYAVVRDAELGEHFLTVGREFPIDFDPSMWQSLELVK